MPVCRSGESAIAAEVFMSDARWTVLGEILSLPRNT
jgi:hypothetical protein